MVQLRETLAATAVVHQKLQNAAEQLKRAAIELEQAFEPAHCSITNEFGEEAGETFFDPVGVLLLQTIRRVHLAKMYSVINCKLFKAIVQACQ